MSSKEEGGLPAISRQLGYGKDFRGTGVGSCDEPGTMMAVMLETIQGNLSDTPVVLQNRQHFSGPLTDGVGGGVQSFLDAKVNILQNKAADAVAQDTLGFNTAGAPSTAFLILGVFAHLIPPSVNFTVKGGSWTKPTAATTRLPVVPDVWWSGVDDLAAAAGARVGLGLNTGETLKPAKLNQGDWTQEMFYQMARAYNWTWKQGTQRTILDWPLRHIAKVIPQPQPDTSAQSVIEVSERIRAANDYYRNPPNGAASTDIFLPRNARWAGVQSVAAIGATAAAERSLFTPNGDGTYVSPTYGGIGVEELGCNMDYFRLPYAIVWPRSLTFEMFFSLVDSNAQLQARQWASLAQNSGVTPPFVQQLDSQISTTATIGTGADRVFPVLSSDSPATQQNFQCSAGMAIYKIGDWYASIGAVGRELSETQYESLKNNKGDITQALANANISLMFP